MVGDQKRCLPLLRLPNTLWHGETDLSYITSFACLIKWGSSPLKCTFAQTMTVETAGFGISGVTDFIFKMSLFYKYKDGVALVLWKVYLGLSQAGIFLPLTSLSACC